MKARRQAGATARSSPGFVAAVVVTLTAAAFSGVMVLLMLLRVDLPGALGQMTHFQEPHHRIHDLTFGVLFLPAIAGAVAQLRRPVANTAGMVMAIVPSVGLLFTLLVELLTTGTTRVAQPPWIIVAAGVLLSLGLHPAGRDFFGSFRVSRLEPLMFGLVVIAALPLLGLARANIALQTAAGDDHAAAGHYGFMAAFGLTVIGIGVLASLRADGWRLNAWVAGLLPALLGASSLIYPEASSSLSPSWAIAAIGWGVVLIAVAEVGGDPTQSPRSTRRLSGRSAP